MSNTSKKVNMTSDGLALSPGEYASLLTRLSKGGKLDADSYGVGGNVLELEQKMAGLLGKESALVMPTGTMANLLALQYLAKTDPKIIVQRESHLYNDCGDCASALAGLQLVPLGEAAEFYVSDVEAAIARARAGKVEAPPGVISIESPVRRQDGKMFSLQNMHEIADLARENNIRLHLDGARLPVAAAYTGHAMNSYAALFDTVYVSLYKCFNSLSGGILTGDSDLIGRLRHWRRRNGGGMAQLWPIAAVALHYLPGIVERLEDAIDISGDFFKRLGDDARFQHIPVSNGSSVSRVIIQKADTQTLERIRNDLRARAIYLPRPDGNPLGFTIKVNESWRHTTPEILFSAFQEVVTAA